MSNNFVAISKVQGASYKIAELIIKQPKVVMAVDGRRGVEGQTEGVIDMDSVTFAYPTKKDVNVLKNVTINCPQN